MNKWELYWMLHCIGFAGLAATLIVLPYWWLPGYVMGAAGGCWMAGFMCLARWLVMLNKTPNVGIEPPKVGSNDGLGVLVQKQ